jgi:hypothetical protein
MIRFQVYCTGHEGNGGHRNGENGNVGPSSVGDVLKRNIVNETTRILLTNSQFVSSISNTVANNITNSVMSHTNLPHLGKLPHIGNMDMLRTIYGHCVTNCATDCVTDCLKSSK